MTSPCDPFKTSTTLYFKKELHRKMMTRKTAYDFLEKIKELKIDYMERAFMHMNCQKKRSWYFQELQGDS